MRALVAVIALTVFLACASLAQAAPSPVTSYRQMTALLHADAARSPWVSVASAGQSAHGRALWLVRLRDPAVPSARTVRLFVMCRQHGDEPASTEALLGLIARVSNGAEPALLADLRHVTVYIVPMVNPDGAELGTRLSATHADLNRDWGPFAQPETRAMAGLLTLLRPALVVDAHNWDSGDQYNADCLEIRRADHSPLGEAELDLQQEFAQSLASTGYHVQSFAYGQENDPRLAHRYCTHLGLPSMLVETLCRVCFGYSRLRASRRDVCRPDPFPGAPLRLGKPRCPARRAEAGSHAVYARPRSRAVSHCPPAVCGEDSRHATRPRAVPCVAMGTLRLRPCFRRVGPGQAPFYRYSLTWKFDGTETRVHSGHRKALSSPPR